MENSINSYSKPQVLTVDGNMTGRGVATKHMGGVVWKETVAVAYVFLLALAVVSQIDVTP